MPRSSTAHTRRMADRRRAQLSRQPGFTPVPNGRFDRAVVAEIERLSKVELERPTPPRDAEIILREAIRNVAAQLPARAGKILRAVRPSKSDSPAYRNPVRAPA